MTMKLASLMAAGCVALLPCASYAAGPATFETNPVTSRSHSYESAGSNQFGLTITSNTQLTVPAGAVCAYITVETANVRRTSDGTSATTTNGTLITAGTQWADCGPLAAYKFTAVSGSPTLDVEYFQ